MAGTREVSRRTWTRTDDAGLVAPIMIQVPAIRPVPHRSMMQTLPKPRRRLRREFRQVGLLLLLATMLSLGYWAGSRSGGGVMTAAATKGQSSPTAPFLVEIPAPPASPAVTLSIEPIATVAARPEPEPEISATRSVELESTLLPVDGSEDPPYEGR